MRIGVSKDTLLSSETVEVAIVALVGGHFVFPEKTQVVSAIYGICVSRELLKPLRVDVQHCVNIRKSSQMKYLKFAIAAVETPSLPYQFEVTEGGEFTIDSFYGSIYRQKFSLLGILAENGDPPSEDEDDTSSDDDDTNGQKGQNGGTNTDGTSSDDESTQSNESLTHGQSL